MPKPRVLALKKLATHPTPMKDEVGTLRYTINGVREHFGVTLNPAWLTDVVWTTAHADLHWATLLFAVCRYPWIADEGGEYETLGTPLRMLGAEVIELLGPSAASRA